MDVMIADLSPEEIIDDKRDELIMVIWEQILPGMPVWQRLVWHPENNLDFDDHDDLLYFILSSRLKRHMNFWWVSYDKHHSSSVLDCSIKEY